jgi:MFS family permease
MAVAISARTSFSLLYPEILKEFGWSRGLTAGAYSVGYIASMALLPIVGFLMERAGPRLVIPLGALLTAAGFVLVTFITEPIGFYVAMGLFIVNGSMATSYVVHSMFLPNWFVRNRGLAIGIAFSGVGVGALIILPVFQYIIDTSGWRDACLKMALIVVAAIIPLNVIFQRVSPQSIGLLPDGDRQRAANDQQPVPGSERIINRTWANTDWTVGRALCTVRFWAMFTALFCALFVWYGLQAHQTKFLIDEGFDPGFAATALGLAAFFGIFGQIGIGALSDRIGRELAWTLALAGFGGASVLMVLISQSPAPSTQLVYLAMAAQGLLGYGMATLFGAIITEVFAGRRAASILALMGLGGNLGGAAGPWVLGLAYDAYGNYEVGFWICWGVSIASIICIWIVSPGRIRMVAGEAKRSTGRTTGRTRRA